MPCSLRREAKTSEASFDKAKSLTRSMSWLWLKGFTLLYHSAVVSDILSPGTPRGGVRWGHCPGTQGARPARLCQFFHDFIECTSICDDSR